MVKRKPRKYHKSATKRVVADPALVWKLVRQARRGDQHAFVALMDMHKWVRESMAVKLSRCFPDIDIDDAMQASNIGFWNAVLDFDPKFGSALSSHAVFRIMTQQNNLKAKLRLGDDKDVALPPDLVQPHQAVRKGMTQSQKQLYRKAMRLIARMGAYRMAALRDQFDLNLPVADVRIEDHEQQIRLYKDAITKLKREFGVPTRPRQSKKKP